MVRFLIGIILAILIILIGGFVYFDGQKNLERERIVKEKSKITPSPTIKQSSIPKDFIPYKTSDYALYYHPKMIIKDEGNGYTAFVLIGATQKGQTELYDGINFTIRSGNYTEKNIREFVENEVEKLQKDGTSKTTQGILSVSIGEKDGFEFKSRGLGEFRQIYFDKGNNKFVHVVIMSEDPKKVGYEKIVEQMLQSVRF